MRLEGRRRHRCWRMRCRNTVRPLHLIGRRSRQAADPMPVPPRSQDGRSGHRRRHWHRREALLALGPSARRYVSWRARLRTWQGGYQWNQGFQGRRLRAPWPRTPRTCSPCQMRHRRNRKRREGRCRGRRGRGSADARIPRTSLAYRLPVRDAPQPVACPSSCQAICLNSPPSAHRR
jgi:hypothetical protein